MARRFDPDEINHLKEQLPDLVKEISKKLSHLKREPGHAILDENGQIIPIEVYDRAGTLNQSELIRWATWFERNTHQRIVERTEVGEHFVSTVFLGLNHQFWPGAKALWFETMVFGPPRETQLPISGELYMSRESLWSQQCSTKAEAIAMHEKGLAWLKEFLTKKTTQRNPE